MSCFPTAPLFDAHPSGRTSCNINVIYTPLKKHLMDYNFVADNMSIFIRLAVVGSQICEIPRNFELYNRSWSSKVIDLGVNRKHICDFLLVINSNFGRISHSFRAIYVLNPENNLFPTLPSLTSARGRGNPL